MYVSSHHSRVKPTLALSLRHKTPALATLAMLFSASVLAQQQPHTTDAEQNTPTLLPAVTINANTPDTVTEGSESYTITRTQAATRLPLALQETPQSVSVMTRQLMDDQALNSVQDVLEASTGISSATLDSERVSFYARGFAIDSFQYDGIPTSFQDGTSFLDSAFYDRIEVVRGATGLLTGAGNPSASVNLVRKRPGKELSVLGTVNAGSWDNYRAMADVSTPLTENGTIRARVVGVYQDRKSYMDFYQQKKKAFYGVLEADLGPNTTLSLGIDYQSITPTGTTWGGVPLWFSDGSRTDWSRSESLAARWSYWDNTLKSLFADLEHHFENGWTLRAALKQQRTDSDARLFSGLGYPDKTTGQGLLPVSLANYGDTRQNSFDAMASGPFSLFGRQHELVVGVMGSRRTANDYSTGFIFPSTPIGNIYDWDGRYPEPDFDSAGYNLTHTTTTQGGLYGLARLSLSDSLKLIMGGRFSYYKINQRAPNTAFSYKKDSKFTPYIGIVYDLTDSYALYASHTQIFNPQNYKDRNNHVLPPTTGKNTEIGIKAEYLDGQLNASIALFETRLQNVAQIDTGHMLPDGTQAYYAANGTKSRGIDVELQGEVTEGWHLYAGLSHFTASDANGERLSSQLPRTTARLFTSYRLPGEWSSLTLGGGVTWQSRFYQSATGPQGSTVVEQSSYPLASLMAKLQINKQLSMALHIDNLFDKKYAAMTGFYNQILYGEPRRFMFSLNYQM
ncbi:TonB-dependent siderophore receptor [Paenalcaligenes sp. Me131]|uniref:TonB-dependent siderophore receptor n=1 Tax=Paenalcaligenes sp. Me131 TaxID=3392636 RepID=UPI003D2E5225